MPCKTLTLVVFRTKYLMLLQDINQVTPRDTVYSRGKGVCEQKTTDCCLRQSVGQKRSYRGPRGILCTRGEKEHTSKRVSVIASDNVISKAKRATRGRGFAHSCKSSLRSPNATSQTALLTKQTLFICLFVFCLFIPLPHGYTVSRGDPESRRWGSCHGPSAA